VVLQLQIGADEGLGFDEGAGEDLALGLVVYVVNDEAPFGAVFGFQAFFDDAHALHEVEVFTRDFCAGDDDAEHVNGSASGFLDDEALPVRGLSIAPSFGGEGADRSLRTREVDIQATGFVGYSAEHGDSVVGRLAGPVSRGNSGTSPA
jgi:hypothetical protein